MHVQILLGIFLAAMFFVMIWAVSLLIRFHWRMRGRFWIVRFADTDVAKLHDFSLSLPGDRFSIQRDRIIKEDLLKKSVLLCHQGEELAQYILDVYGYDLDAQLMKRKLAFMRDYSDRFLEHARLPHIVYSWDLQDLDDGSREKAQRFEEDWELLAEAFREAGSW